METLALRLLPYAIADGAYNMAADEVMLTSAAEEGLASLRFYGWMEATVSLGYFQSSQARLLDSRQASLPWVRRSSGGGTLVHHHELTYCLALPPASPQAGEPWMRRMHAIIARALNALGCSGMETVTVESKRADGALCLLQHTRGDLTCHGHKVVGSAQRKYRQALMQHGAILLETSPFSPQLLGIQELTQRTISLESLQQALCLAFANSTAWVLTSAPWPDEEAQSIGELAARKYGLAAWKERR